MSVTNPNGNVPAQIESCSLPPNSPGNVQPHHVNAVRAECTKCGLCAVANPEAEFGGPVTQRKAAIRTALAKLEAECPHPLPWGIAPRHEDRRIPRGVTVWCEELGTQRLLPVRVNEKGKLEGAWGGVALDAVVWVIPDTDSVLADADDLAQRLAPKPAPKRKTKPETKPKRKRKRAAAPKGYTNVRVGKAGTAPKREAVES